MNWPAGFRACTWMWMGNMTLSGAVFPDVPMLVSGVTRVPTLTLTFEECR